MSEIPFHVYGEDGALYTVDVIRDRRDESNPHYDVDLVRSMTGRFGESLEQRLTLAEYDERDEAQAHCNEAEQMLYEQGLDGLGDAKERVLKEPILYDGEYLFVSYPPEAQGTDRAAAQLLWLGENGLQSERLAFGTTNDMELITSECERDWIEGKLPNMMLGQEHQLTDNTNSPAATTVQYHFDYNLFGTDALVLEAHKAWRDSDGVEGRASVILDFYEGNSDGSVLERFEREAERLNGTQSEQGIQSAMNEAEKIAVANHLLDPERDDPRLFTEGPHDPFMTAREHELIEQERRTIYEAWAEESRREQEANAHLEGAVWFEATFENSERQLLEPVDAAVNYGVVVQDADPWTMEVAVEKYWREPDDSLGIASLTLKTFDPLYQREEAEQERSELLETYEQHGLETLMHRAELTASEHYSLDPHRVDLRLFSDGPPDRFQTLAQRLENELNPYWNVGDDRIEEAPAPGSWEELIAQQPDEELEPERHYWQIDYRPAETPYGESLGVALFITEFPQLPPDFEDNIEMYAMDNSMDPTEARTLEMAHFANKEDAKKFEAEFRSYLVPDLLDGPELAPEVAKLEGLSGEWQEMDYRGIVDYMSGNRTIVREKNDWHLHNPIAERDAHIEVEALNHDLSFKASSESKMEL
jgi:hypothetical protein